MSGEYLSLDTNILIYAVDRDGLLVRGMNGLTETQGRLAQPRDVVAGWTLRSPGRIDLEDVMVNARPTTLIGVSGQAGVFTEPIVRAMAAGVARPVIFPLSNPTSRCEATPQDLMNWSDGRAIVGSGSPFEPVEIDGRKLPVDQTNNAYIFPGLGLGLIASRARRVTDRMLMAAARALADLSPARRDKQASLLPPVEDLRAVAVAVATAVSRQAQADGVADPCGDDELAERIRGHIWTPVYRPYRRAGA